MHGPFQVQPFVLQEATIPVQDTSRCPGIHPLLQVCAGGAGSSTCLGDSGGPLACLDNGVWVLEGITSFGFSKECFPFQPSVYTRVSSLVNWIHSIISGN